MERLHCDVVVIGSGVAGLTTAVAMSSRRVALVTKTELGAGSTWWAQGGIAASISREDSPDRHADDTIAVGAGLNDPRAVEALADDAVSGIRHLLERGARFDLGPDGELLLGREAGHSVRRILHTDGDATGAEVSRALVAAARRANHVDLHEHMFAADLILEGGRVRGITARDGSGQPVALLASAVVLATGGIGRIYANTTNPIEVTGDGLAIAARAGAHTADLEFVQFHPTALASGVDPMPLLTEALRGEGALLIDDKGERFMVAEHRDAELAPRDIVARAVWRRSRDGHRVFLDARKIGAIFPQRFPTVFRICTDAGIDPRLEPVPVAPAAHFHMGGVAVGLDGRTSVPGLWAVGEVSRSGVHGANRLASNSLLEGLVFGERVAADITAATAGAAVPDGLPITDPGPAPAVDPTIVPELRRVMWERVGVVRDDSSLRSAVSSIQALEQRLPAAPSEAANMVLVGKLVAQAALARTESRGAHYRSDYPELDETYSVRMP